MNNLVAIVVDRLHTGLVGAYGNAWIRTPHFDRFACESFLFDEALVDCPALESLYRAYWQGLHALAPEAQARAATSLPEQWSAVGVHSALITDEERVARHPLAAHFAERIYLEPSEVAQPADDLEDTAQARLFAAAAEWLATAPQPFALWIHARGMEAPWDAPQAFRDEFPEFEDPPAPGFVEVPNRRVPADVDPDEVLGVLHAYAGGVTVWDECLGAFLAALDASAHADKTLVALQSARGFPLAEHGRIGGCDEPLYNELTQTLLALRFPDRAGALGRSQALVQPADLAGAIADWFRFSAAFPGAASLLPLVRGERESLRDHAILVSPSGARAIHTRAWRLIANGPENAPALELFAKPSDRWEVNEISSRAPQIADELAHLLAQSIQSARSGSSPALAEPLAEALVTEVD